jgi:hypothetical protein
VGSVQRSTELSQLASCSGHNICRGCWYLEGALRLSPSHSPTLQCTSLTIVHIILGRPYGLHPTVVSVPSASPRFSSHQSPRSHWHTRFAPTPFPDPPSPQVPAHEPPNTTSPAPVPAATARALPSAPSRPRGQPLVAPRPRTCFPFSSLALEVSPSRPAIVRLC